MPATANAQSFDENWLRSRSCVKHRENDACNLAFILFVDLNTGGSCEGLRIFSRILRDRCNESGYWLN